MTGPAVARRGEMFPGFTLRDIDSSSFVLESYRGRTNLVVVFAGANMGETRVTVLLEELDARADELTLEVAQVIVVTPSRPAVPRRGRWAFPVLLDDGAHIHRNVGATDAGGSAAPAVFVADRFREVYAAYLPGPGSALLGAKEILDWLVFIQHSVPGMRRLRVADALKGDHVPLGEQFARRRVGQRLAISCRAAARSARTARRSSLTSSI